MGFTIIRRNSAVSSRSLTIPCLFLIVSLSAQNLIENPSFEQYENCPERLGNFDADVVSWSTPTDGSTDYFNACSTAMGTPKNFNGEQASDFGKGYAGLYLYAPDDYREYLQAELAEPLEKGKNYKVSFFVSLAERSDFAVKEFGILFAKDKMDIPIKKDLSKRHWYAQKGNKYNFLEIAYTNFYSDTEDWISVSTQFIAKGTERFMTIGNFENNPRTRKFKTKRNAKQGAYYYVDRVVVEASGPKKVAENDIIVEVYDQVPRNESKKGMTVKTEDEAPPKKAKILQWEGSEGRKPSIELNRSHIFENVIFEFDRFNLLPGAKKELDRIHSFLKSDETFRISLSGHTDNMGTATYNKKLSENRCRAVAEYLMELGLSKERISWKGYGSSKPIADNSSEENRKRNRRVEFVIRGN